MSKLIKKEEPNIIYSSDGSHKNTKMKESYIDINPSETTLFLKREKKSRGGKFVLIISNLPANPPYFKDLLKQLKSRFGCGGSFKDEELIIQGDIRDKVEGFLQSLGFKTKNIGG